MKLIARYGFGDFLIQVGWPNRLKGMNLGESKVFMPILELGNWLKMSEEKG